jgi:uncharacterized protein (DUF433 family)
MATPTTTLRLRPKLRDEIDRIARRSRRSFSDVTQDLLDEALRMREVPGIYFANEPAGREVKVAGTGLGVWEVIRDYLAAGEKEAAVRRAMPHLTPAQVKTCLLYYERYPEEIRAEIEDNESLAHSGSKSGRAFRRS